MTKIRITYKLALAIAVCAMAIACNRVPDYVIQPEEMSQLMADIHVAESAMDLDFTDYHTDSARKAVKQELLAKHHVTSAQLDTSMMWYGAHLKTYMDVYDRTSEILQERLDKNSAVSAELASLSVTGDSVNVWSMSPRMAISSKTSSPIITFNYKKDGNWENGDSYTWRMKFLNAPGEVQWSMVAEYADGATEVLNTRVFGEGWQEMQFRTDSTRIVSNIYGYLSIEPKSTAVYIDSIQMIRKRLEPDKYGMRYRQRLYKMSRL